MITPRRQNRALSAISLCNEASPDQLPIVPNQRETGMKSDRALFQTLQIQTLNTSGATKDRSVTEEVPTTAGHRPQKLRRSQTGLIFRSETLATMTLRLLGYIELPAHRAAVFVDKGDVS
jgi:hypothetical protein